MRFKFPGISPAASQFVAHIVIVFVVAFGGQLTAFSGGLTDEKALLALLTSSGAAGLTAVIHYLLGLVPTPLSYDHESGQHYYVTYGVSLKIRTRVNQLFVSVLATFLSIFGAALVAGATKVTSLPSVTDLTMAAISAGVVGAVQFAVGLIPAPKATSAAQLPAP